jgi:tetratricopeptide (TPR) repeat protein
MILALALVSAISTAQTTFAQGLTDLYAYAGPQAAEQFVATQHADESALLAYWGEALARGTDLNNGISAARFAAAQAAIAKAAPHIAGAGAQDRALANAVTARYAGTYADRDRDETAYRTAMEQYVAQYPQDDDGTMILVEDLLERHGMTWMPDGAPFDDTSAEILRLTQTVLTRNPSHLFANHLCIHMYDNAPDRTPAIACAQRLDAMTFTVPEEHLAHMPAHTWVEIGDGRAALNSSERAWQLDPTIYAEHDAYVALTAALMCGDLEAVARWRERLGALEGALPNISPPDYITSARSAEAAGKIDDALQILQQQAKTQSSLTELVPFYPADEAAAALLVRAGRYAEARDAFAAILASHPRRPRALFGMSVALERLGQSKPAQQYRTDFAKYWAGGNLTIEDY